MSGRVGGTRSDTPKLKGHMAANIGDRSLTLCSPFMYDGCNVIETCRGQVKHKVLSVRGEALTISTPLAEAPNATTIPHKTPNFLNDFIFCFCAVVQLSTARRAADQKSEASHLVLWLVTVFAATLNSALVAPPFKERGPIR